MTIRVPRIHSSDAVFDRVMAKLDSVGLGRWPRPIDEDGKYMNPVLPPDITYPPDDLLFRLYGQFVAMAQWVGVQHGIIQAQRAIVEDRREKLRSRVWLRQNGNREDKKAKVDTDPEVQEIDTEFTVLLSTEGLTYPIFNGYLLGKEATSRELTRRLGADWERKTFTPRPSNRVSSR